MTARIASVVGLGAVLMLAGARYDGGRALVLADDTCVPGEAASLNVKPVAQIGRNLCWAAAGEMVMRYKLGCKVDAPIGPEDEQSCGSAHVSQCVQVENRRGLKAGTCLDQTTQDCNPSVVQGNAKECDWASTPEFASLGFSCHRRETALSWDELKRKLSPDCEGTPVAFGWSVWRGSKFLGNHFMVAIGYATGHTRAGERHYVLFLDPGPLDGNAFGHAYVPYEVWAGGPKPPGSFGRLSAKILDLFKGARAANRRDIQVTYTGAYFPVDDPSNKGNQCALEKTP